MDEIILTPLAVSLEVRRSVGFVRNSAISGKLPSIVTTTGRRLFRKGDVDIFKASLTKSERQPSEAA